MVELLIYQFICKFVKSIGFSQDIPVGKFQKMAEVFAFNLYGNLLLR